MSHLNHLLLKLKQSKHIQAMVSGIKRSQLLPIIDFQTLKSIITPLINDDRNHPDEFNFDQALEQLLDLVKCQKSEVNIIY